MPVQAAGYPCLDFINTVGDHASAAPREYLNSYQDLLAWSVRADLVSDREAAELRDRARREPRRAQSAHERAIETRETMYRIFAAFTHGHEPSPRDLAAFNDSVRQAQAQRSMVFTGSKFEWRWEPARQLDGMLPPILQCAADLLASDAAQRVGQCADEEGCGWFFLDTSHARKRKWCDMNDCGNRAKARRHYARMKQKARTRGSK